MTILTSLLIASQGLLPSPTPLSIGTQGLLQTGGAPPPPPVVAKDLPGSGGIRRPETIVKIRGVKAKLTTDGVDITISASVQAAGNRAASGAGAPAQHVSTAFQVEPATLNASASRAKPSISTSFEIVGCEEDDEAAIRMLAQAALEEFYLQNIIDSYDD